MNGSTSVRSSRKYAVQIPSSPLARDSTGAPLRVKRNDSFSTAQHTQGLGKEVKEAMLRSGVQVSRTPSSLRIIATKGNATLTLQHKVFIPELERYRKNYAWKEGEFAEVFPSACSPFQFLSPSEETEKIPRKSVINLEEEDPQKLRDWCNDMRLKVHMRVAQKQQMENIKLLNPIDSLPNPKFKSDQEQKRSPPKGLESERKKRNDKTDKSKMSSYDTIAPTSPKRSTFFRSADKDKDKGHDDKDDTIHVHTPHTPHRSAAPSPPLSPHNNNEPQTPKKALKVPSKYPSPHPPESLVLFQSRKNPTLTRRFSEFDMRRIRIRARNSVGIEEPIS